MKGRTIGAFFIDYAVAAVICNIPFYALIILPVMFGHNPLAEHGASGMIVRALCATYIGVLYLVVRDAFPKCSIGKRITKLTVIDTRTGVAAKPMKKILKNIFWLLGPVEAIVFLASGKTIGERISRTQITLRDAV